MPAHPLSIPNFSSPLEVWGGLECTLNRVHSVFYDQLEWSGHYLRDGDLERFAGLEIRALRFPILWEKWGQREDWSWLDARLAKLRELGIRPIVGLLHHGSGPVETNLLDTRFPERFAAFAGRVAARYPWVGDYTPVNEPLTTARFCALYGYWFPHARADSSFIRALVHQLQGTVLAMRAIRKIQPAARLIQTEDLARTHSVPRLRYQAAFENERRWLTFDLLMGRVDAEHPIYQYLHRSGLSPDEVSWFADNANPPDLLGLNHYVTSERFLDDRLADYPVSAHGGNGKHRYVDTEAVRHGLARGPQSLFRECWERYRAPMAVTEAHLGCTREEQLRWLLEIWRSAQALRGEGVDLRAVTSWALLGSFEWNSLVTRVSGHYEPGAFDVRSEPPRETAVAGLVRALAKGETAHVCSGDAGWWKGPRRPTGRPLLIAGSGHLGLAFQKLCERRGLAAVCLPRAVLDITDGAGVRSALTTLQPWAVVNAAGYADIDGAEADTSACFQANIVGAKVLASETARIGTRFLTFSSDQLFDGRSRVPYLESDAVNPLNAYGRSQMLAEEAVTRLLPGALLVRTAALFSPWSGSGQIVANLARLHREGRVDVDGQSLVSPTGTCDLVDAALDLLLDGASGVWHLTHGQSLTWLEITRQLARRAGLDSDLIRESSVPTVALRPLYSVLGSQRGQLLPSFQQGLERFFGEGLRPWETTPIQPCELVRGVSAS